MAHGEIPDHLHEALLEGDCDLVRAWFEADESRDPNMGSPPLLYLALRSKSGLPHSRGDRTEMVRLLGARGADMNLKQIPWLKPLFWSANAGAFVGEMSAMIDYGADVNASSSPNLRSILMFCSRYREWNANAFSLAPLARLLVRRGADVFLKDKEGLDAEDHARFYIHEREDGSALADFLAAVKRAGSYAAYVRAPRVKLVRLRTLCARGRARPPADPVLERLFGGAPETPSTTKSPRSSPPLPNEVFWHVVAYWRTSRDDE